VSAISYFAPDILYALLAPCASAGAGAGAGAISGTKRLSGYGIWHAMACYGEVPSPPSPFVRFALFTSVVPGTPSTPTPTQRDRGSRAQIKSQGARSTNQRLYLGPIKTEGRVWFVICNFVPQCPMPTESNPTGPLVSRTTAAAPAPAASYGEMTVCCLAVGDARRRW
jgi:hypothetical protein